MTTQWKPPENHMVRMMALSRKSTTLQETVLRSRRAGAGGQGRRAQLASARPTGGTRTLGAQCQPLAVSQGAPGPSKSPTAATEVSGGEKTRDAGPPPSTRRDAGCLFINLSKKTEVLTAARHSSMRTTRGPELCSGARTWHVGATGAAGAGR